VGLDRPAVRCRIGVPPCDAASASRSGAPSPVDPGQVV